MLEAFHTTNVIGFWFPELKKEFGDGHKLDLRCTFSKTSLSEKLSTYKPTEITLKSGNKINFVTSIGCGVFIEQAELKIGEENAHYSDPNRWKNWKSFYFTLEGSVKMNIEKKDKV